jgi:hypothetical protein
LDKDIQNCFVRLDTLKFGVYIAVLCFSDDVAKKNDVLNILDVRSAQTCECCEADRYGKWKAEIAALSIKKEARKNKVAQKRRKEDQDGPDNPEYGARKHQVGVCITIYHHFE